MKSPWKLGLPLLGMCASTLSAATAAPASSNPPMQNGGCNTPNNSCWYVDAAYTLWIATQDGMGYGFGNFYSPSTASPTQGSTFFPSQNLRSGFKVGTGFYMCDKWSLDAEYVWFYNNAGYSNASSFTSGDAYAGYSAIQLPADVSSYLTSASSQWKNQFNRASLTAGYMMGKEGEKLSFTPFLGFLGAWETQHFNVDAISVSESVASTIRTNQNWWAVGPYAGSDATYHFNCDPQNMWSMFFTNGLSLDWSHWSVNTTDVDPSGLTALSNNGTQWNTQPMVEVAVGLRFKTSWDGDYAGCFMLQAAWEAQTWFGHNQMFSAYGLPGGNYSMQGLTVKAMVAF